MYLNLTDFEYEGNNQRIEVPEERSDYIVSFYNYKSTNANDFLYSRISIDEIKEIIGIKSDKTFARANSFTGCLNGVASSKFADLMYAEALVNTGSHKRIIVYENRVCFQKRTAKKSADGKKTWEWQTYIELNLIRSTKTERG